MALQYMQRELVSGIYVDTRLASSQSVAYFDGENIVPA
ncbi:hypothetical protein SB521682_1647 [Shigella boydii 5216-82]|nr:hypothetical protein SB521682_1647 [Shigella boydii 5216-82]